MIDIKNCPSTLAEGYTTYSSSAIKNLRNLRDLRENKISVKILTLIPQISRIYF